MVPLVLLCIGVGVVNVALSLVLAQWLAWPWAVLIVSPCVFVASVIVTANAVED